MSKETTTKLFEEKQVRSLWAAEQEKVYISILDIIEILTESIDPNAYWRKLKQQLKEEGSELYDKIVQLKFEAANVKKIRNRWFGSSRCFPPHSIHSIPQGRAI
jgi:hypothetical protein